MLERLQVRQQAREAWDTYLQLDPDSSWSGEARRRLAALEASTALRPRTGIERALRDPAVDVAVIREAVSRDSMEVRALLVKAILPQWAAEAGSASDDARLYQAQRSNTRVPIPRSYSEANIGKFNSWLRLTTTGPPNPRAAEPPAAKPPSVYLSLAACVLR